MLRLCSDSCAQCLMTMTALGSDTSDSVFSLQKAPSIVSVGSTGGSSSFNAPHDSEPCTCMRSSSSRSVLAVSSAKAIAAAVVAQWFDSWYSYSSRNNRRAEQTGGKTAAPLTTSNHAMVGAEHQSYGLSGTCSVRGKRRPLRTTARHAQYKLTGTFAREALLTSCGGFPLLLACAPAAAALLLCCCRSLVSPL
jgi:hypothetical protein